MSARDEIVRWSADPDAPAGMRELVRRATAADAGPSPVELASMRGRIAAQLAAKPVVTAALIGARTIVVGLIVAAIGAGVIVYVATRATPPALPAAQPAAIPAAPVAVAPPPTAAATAPVVPPSPPAPPPPAPAPPAPAPPLHRVPAPAHAVVGVHATPAAHAAPAPAPSPPSAPPRISEVALLEQARGALRSGHGAEALALTDQHATLYADGTLTEEREALAIEALIGLDRRADATARWSKFAIAYPHSNYRARLQRLIDERTSP
jgi:hypothetical protein